MLFYHRGSQGDIVYSIPTIIASGGGDLCLGKRNHFDNMRRLLSGQTCIGRVLHVDHLPSWDGIDRNLDAYRRVERDNPNQHLALSHLQPWNLTYDLSKPWLDNIESNPVAEIVINRTPRYHDREEIDWSLLHKYARHCAFIGTDRDYASFCQVSGPRIRRHRCRDALDFGRAIRGSRLYIGNQSLGFALAEGMKHPRILEVYYSRNNCHPNSRNGHTCLTEGLVEAYLHEENQQAERSGLQRESPPSTLLDT